MDSVSLSQVLGAIQLLKPVSHLCGLQWELGQSPDWGQACGKNKQKANVGAQLPTQSSRLLFG